MAIPSVRAVGNIGSSQVGHAPGMPAGTLLGDIMLLFVETAEETFTVTGGTETWTALTPYGTGNGSGATVRSRIATYWARASQDTPISPALSDAGNHTIDRMMAVSGCIATGSPIEAQAGGGTLVATTGKTIPTSTTTVADTLVVLATTLALGATSTTEFTSFTNTDLANITERINNGVSIGNNGSLGVFTGEKAAAGAYGTTAVVHATSSEGAYTTFALIPASTGDTEFVGAIPI